MSITQLPVNRAGPGLLLSIFLCLLSIYLATYSGRIESSDSLRVIDATSSLVNFGDLRRDESLWQEAPRQIPLDELYPFSVYESNEPLIAYIAAIPYSLAKVVPQLGFVHATWLLGIFVIALSGTLFYLLARLLQYDTNTALITTILFAFATLVWAYSKTLFRDPLVIPFLLLLAIFLELWRRDYRRFWWGLLAILAGLAAYYTKNSSIMALPAFVIWLMPDWQSNQTIKRILDGLLALGIAILVLIAFIEPAFKLFAEFVGMFIKINTQYAQTALHSYLFSIGGSIWGTSPILLAGVLGGILLIRQNQRRLVWAVVAMVVTYALGHALLTGIHWFGGLSLPPRFMLPTIPFAMLLSLPVVDAVLKSKQMIWKLLFFVLGIFSMAVQLIFALSLLDAYVELLPPESNGLVEWLPGLNQLAYLRWRLLPLSWDSLGWDVAWTHINRGYIGVIFVILAIISASAMIREKCRLWLNLTAIAGILITGTFAFQQLYQHDARYWADTPELFETLSILEQEAEAIEPLFMAGSADVTYERFILNYNGLTTVRPIVIGFQAGERASPTDEPSIASDFTMDLISITMLRFMDRVISNHERFWWLAHNSDFATWAIRPEERFFTENYYLLNHYRTDEPSVRLLEFSSIPAPSRYGFRLPDYESNLQFGDHISLEGYSLPAGETYSVGDIVPITFYWQSDTLLEQDYTVSWFLVQEGVYLLQGHDSPPDNGFTLTTTWEVNQLVYDNRAIELPAELPTGEYQIWLRLYPTGSDGSQPLSVSGGASYEETTAILPTRINVINAN